MIYNADDFLVANGIVDDTAALQGLFNKLLDGDEIDFSTCGNIKISSTVTIGNGSTTQFSTINNIRLKFWGTRYETRVMDPTATQMLDIGKKFIWAGGASPMFKLAGPILGIQTDGWWYMDGASTATVGLQAISVSYSDFHGILVANCTSKCVDLNTVAATNISTQYNGLTSGCNYWKYIFCLSPSSTGIGLSLDGYRAAGGQDVTQNEFGLVKTVLSATAGKGINLGYCDWNHFDKVITMWNGAPGVNCYDLYLDGTTTPFNAPAANGFNMFAPTSKFGFTGTPGECWIDKLTPETTFTLPTGAILSYLKARVYKPSDYGNHWRTLNATDNCEKFSRMDLVIDAIGPYFRWYQNGGTGLGEIYGDGTFTEFGTVSNIGFAIKSNNTRRLWVNADGSLGHTDTNNKFVKPDSSIGVVTLTDAAATNSSLYFSSTQGKLCWKDSAGVVRVLY